MGCSRPWSCHKLVRRLCVRGPRIRTNRGGIVSSSDSVEVAATDSRNSVVESYLGWRWVFWTMMIFAGTCTIIMFFTQPETFAPVILQNKVRQYLCRISPPSLIYFANQGEEAAQDRT